VNIQPQKNTKLRPKVTTSDYQCPNGTLVHCRGHVVGVSSTRSCTAAQQRATLPYQVPFGMRSRPTTRPSQKNHQLQLRVATGRTGLSGFIVWPPAGHSVQSGVRNMFWQLPGITNTRADASRWPCHFKTVLMFAVLFVPFLFCL